LPKLTYKVIKRRKNLDSFSPHLFDEIIINFAWKSWNISRLDGKGLSKFLHNRTFNLWIVMKTSDIHDWTIELSIKLVNAHFDHFFEGHCDASPHILKDQNVIFFEFSNDLLLQIAWKNVHVTCLSSIWQHYNLLAVPKRSSSDSFKFHCMQSTNIFDFLFCMYCVPPSHSLFQFICIHVFRNLDFIIV